MSAVMSAMPGGSRTGRRHAGGADVAGGSLDLFQPFDAFKGYRQLFRRAASRLQLHAAEPRSSSASRPTYRFPAFQIAPASPLAASQSDVADARRGELFSETVLTFRHGARPHRLCARQAGCFMQRAASPGPMTS